MSKVIPKIKFKSKVAMDIDVMTFGETYEKLMAINDHDPFNPHKIQFYLILVVIKGNYSHFVDFKFYKLEKGSVLFVAKNQVHHFTNDLKNVKGYSLVINSDFLEKNYLMSKTINLNRLYNYHLETPLMYPTNIEDDDFISVVRKLYSEYQFPNSFAKPELLSAYLKIILLKAERIKQSQANNELNPHWLNLFNNFKNLLEEGYSKSRSSRLYASRLFISYKLLNDIVKAYTNKTVKTFIDDFVMIEIQRFLASTTLSIKEISYKTGFDEPSNMVKFFKKHANKTPQQFRE